jgi:hypothetical protein
MELMNADSNENETQTEQNKQHNGGVNQLLNEKNGQLSEETFIIKFFLFTHRVDCFHYFNIINFNSYIW